MADVSATGRGAAYERLARYYTPELLARTLVRELPLRSGQVVLEPHVGSGAWGRAVEFSCWERKLKLKMELMDVDPGAPGLGPMGPSSATARGLGDFLLDDPVLQPDWIIGNPPYAIDPEIAVRKYPWIDVAHDREKPVPVAELHVQRALHLVRPKLGSVGFLLRQGFLASGERDALFRQYPPRHIFTVWPRPSFTGGGNDSADYAFIWWDLLHMGPTTWSRVRWR